MIGVLEVLLDLSPAIAIILSVISISLSIWTAIIHYKHLKLEEKERERKRIVEVYRAIIYNWLRQLEYWKKRLVEKRFEIRYFLDEKRCRKIEIESVLGIFTGHEFEKHVLLDRLKEICPEAIDKRENVRKKLKQLYDALENLARKIDTEEFRIRCRDMIKEWEEKNRPARLSATEKEIIEGIIVFLISGERYDGAKQIIDEFEKELKEKQEEIRSSRAWQEILERANEAKNAIDSLYKELKGLMKKHESKYQLALEELKPPEQLVSLSSY